MRSYPAIELQFTPGAETAFDLRDRLMAGLDDYQPTAIEESSTAWRIFFESTDARDRAAAWLRTLGDPRITSQPLEVEDEDWARRSQADLGPVRVGRLVVTPPWCREAGGLESEPGAITIVVVPSTGFGTGHHASTRLCLALLQALPVAGRSLLDIGTGSGVLAIAGARLGACPVTAIDNDPDAVQAASENIALNPTDVPIHLRVADFRTLRDPGRRAQAPSPSPPARADIVVANLTGELLRRTAGDVVSLANPGGDIILSGVLAEEQGRVVSSFESAGAKHARTETEEEWVGLLFKAGGKR